MANLRLPDFAGWNGNLPTGSHSKFVRQVAGQHSPVACATRSQTDFGGGGPPQLFNDFSFRVETKSINNSLAFAMDPV